MSPVNMTESNVLQADCSLEVSDAMIELEGDDDTVSLEKSDQSAFDHQAPFTPEQLVDLEAVYAAHPCPSLAAFAILADAFDVTEYDIYLWFRNRPLHDKSIRSNPTSPSAASTEYTSSFKQPMTSPPSPKMISPDEMTWQVRRALPSMSPMTVYGYHVPKARTVTHGQGHRDLSCHSSGQFQTPPRMTSASSPNTVGTYTTASPSYGPCLVGTCALDHCGIRGVTAATTCHPAPVLACREARYAPAVFPWDQRRPVGSSCFQLESRQPISSDHI